MEQTLPLTPIASQQPVYRRYSITRESEAAPVAVLHSREFFFIGKNTRNIDYLINLFEGGYAAESVAKAIAILKRIDLQSKTIPLVIIVDGNLDLSEVANLNAYLKSLEKFRTIPVIMDTAGNSVDAKDTSILMRLFDDVIDTRKADGKLIQRVDFLAKVKKKNCTRSGFRMEKLAEQAKITPIGIGRRAFDITISLTALIVLSPLMLLIAIAIRLESRGPVFYISKRAGRGYRIFNFYKFRTMRMDAEAQKDAVKHRNEYNEDHGCVFFKITNDPRATRFGRFLRNSSLDELPQFFNVLLGDMSIVGNRPLPLYEAAMLTTNEWSQRFMAPAGITGLWQIRKKDRHCMSVEDRIKLDIAYARKQNFLFDLWIIAHTPPALIQKSNIS
jgi:lipopolysaccharide/colanic/teichoic acid biosynthesis glycosyltransferase